MLKELKKISGHYFLLCDREDEDGQLKDYDWCYDIINTPGGELVEDIYRARVGLEYASTSTQKKVIASTDYRFKLPMLYKAECDNISGTHNVNEIANETYGKKSFFNKIRLGFIVGFHKHQELSYDKKYTHNQIKNAFSFSFNNGCEYTKLIAAGKHDEAQKFVEIECDKFLKSLEPKNSWQVQVTELNKESFYNLIH